MAWTDAKRWVFLKEIGPYTEKAGVAKEVTFERALMQAKTLEATFETLTAPSPEAKKQPSEQDPLVNAAMQAFDLTFRGKIAESKAKEEDTAELDAHYKYLIPKGLKDLIYLPYPEQTTAIKSFLRRARESHLFASLQRLGMDGLLGWIEKRNQEMEACLDDKLLPQRPLSSAEAGAARSAFQRLVVQIKRLYQTRFQEDDPAEKAIRDGFFTLLERIEA